MHRPTDEGLKRLITDQIDKRSGVLARSAASAGYTCEFCPSAFVLYRSCAWLTSAWSMSDAPGR